MKKEWLFFCVFCIPVIYTSVSTSQCIVTFTSTVANNTIATHLSIHSDRLTNADNSLENNSSYTIVPSLKLTAGTVVFVSKDRKENTLLCNYKTNCNSV